MVIKNLGAEIPSLYIGRLTQLIDDAQKMLQPAELAFFLIEGARHLSALASLLIGQGLYKSKS